LIVLLFLVRGILGYISNLSVSWVSERVVMDLRNDMFQKLIQLPTAFYDESTSGALISKLTFDVTQVTEASTKVVTVLLKDALAIVGLVSWMVYLNWRLAMVVIFIAPLVAIIIRLVSRKLRVMSRMVQQSMGDITHVAEESIECQKVVKIFNGQEYEKQRFHDAINGMRKFTMKVKMASIINVPLVQVIVSVGLAAVIYMAMNQINAGELTVGGFVSFFAAMAMVMAPLKRITSVNEQLQRGLAASESIFRLIDEESEPDSGSLEIERARGEVQFKNLNFSYANSPSQALSNIDLHLQPGDTVALVGASGSGKSTLVGLLPRFYNVTDDSILLDGIDINQIKLSSLRNNIALVSQEVVLFNDTVRNNIAYGSMRDATDEQIQHAADSAHVTEFIKEMPDGMQTMIGENGVRLSGGQRQRLAIARALLKNAPVLIMDEATSALDTASEQHIQQALEELRKGRTCIIIAHRLSTIENADRILVMQNGRIVESGTHAELIASEGVYTRLHSIQFADRGEG
jgi:subfamily B ATP-binding cassette protein MsbA